ncbi:hypothetical protein EDB85DRAFT_1926601 [Lactarius pseudohatsudake]|nr:hypothetical protein EDB85DRAFT_1926601 [Lactarius pseudohatsudake]
MEEDLGGNEDSAEEDNINEMVVEAEGCELANGEREDGQSGSNGAEGSGGCASVPNNCADSREGVKGLGVDGRGESAIGGVSVGLVAESNERAPEHSMLSTCSLAAKRDLLSTAATNVGVPASPPAHASLTTERLAGTEDDGGLLRGAQVSSFGRKRKLRNMHDISACLCGRSAAPSAGRNTDESDSDKVLCCRTAGLSSHMCWAFIPTQELDLRGMSERCGYIEAQACMCMTVDSSRLPYLVGTRKYYYI